jgi:hypothetical protein
VTWFKKEESAARGIIEIIPQQHVIETIAVDVSYAAHHHAASRDHHTLGGGHIGRRNVHPVSGVCSVDQVCLLGEIRPREGHAANQDVTQPVAIHITRSAD